MSQTQVWDPKGNLVFLSTEEAKRLISEEGWTAKDPLSKQQRQLRKSEAKARLKAKVEQREREHLREVKERELFERWKEQGRPR